MKADLWLEQYYQGEYFSGKFDHLKSIVKKLDLEPDCKVITVAGTNGKGQTARLLAQGLLTAGFKVAMLTSPHLEQVNERFWFSGKESCDEELIEVFKWVQSNLDQPVSYFEFLFLSFLRSVKLKMPEFAVLEVGLGGRLDAINSVDAHIALITSISRDHQELLGNSYLKIFREKAGVFRSGQLVFTNLSLEYLRQDMRRKADEMNLKHWELNESTKNLDFSQQNQVLAQAVLQELGIKPDWENQSSLSKPVRRVLEFNGIEMECYPSHNPDGLRKLVQFLSATKYNNYDCLLISFSARPRQDLSVMLKILKGLSGPGMICFVHYQHEKALKRDQINLLRDEFDFEILEEASILEELEARSAKKVLVTGSNYFIGRLASLLKS